MTEVVLRIPISLALVAGMDVVSQISFAETFCIVAADAASQGVPLVTSDEVPWGSPLFRANPADVRVWRRRCMRRGPSATGPQT